MDVPVHVLLFVLGIFLAVIPLPATPLSFDIKNFIGSGLLAENGASVSEDGCLQLVGPSNWGPVDTAVGRAWYPSPLLMWDSSGLAGFTTDFAFTSGSGTVGTSSSARCGISFLLKAPDASLDSSTASFLAVQFVCGGGGGGGGGGYGNAASDQINIKINAPKAVFSQKLPGSFTGYPSTARVVYDARSHVLAVYMSHPLYSYTLTGPPVLSYDVDLSKYLPEQVSVGLSGLGVPSRLQTVCSWSFTSEFVTLPAASPPNPTPATATPSPTQTTSDPAATGTPPTAAKSDDKSESATSPKRIGIIVGSSVAALVVVEALGAGMCIIRRIYIKRSRTTTSTNISNGGCEGVESIK